MCSFFLQNIFLGLVLGAATTRTCYGAAVPEAEADATPSAVSDAESAAQYTNLLASTVNAYATAEGLLGGGNGHVDIPLAGQAAPIPVPSVTATQFHAQDEIGQYSYG